MRIYEFLKIVLYLEPIKYWFVLKIHINIYQDTGHSMDEGDLRIMLDYLWVLKYVPYANIDFFFVFLGHFVSNISFYRVSRNRDKT